MIPLCIMTESFTTPTRLPHYIETHSVTPSWAVSLTTILKTPVQRPPRYGLLLDVVAKHSTRELAQLACGRIQQLITALDTNKRDHDAMATRNSASRNETHQSNSSVDKSAFLAFFIDSIHAYCHDKRLS